MCTTYSHACEGLAGASVFSILALAATVTAAAAAAGDN